MDEQQIDQNVDQQEQAPRRRLGRGLSALLGNNTGDNHQYDGGQQGPQSTDEIHVDLIERNPFQPRKEFAADGLRELSESIQKQGVLQPLIVRPFEDRYQLIAGERRLLASKQAGRETISCRVIEADDQTVCEIAIDENLKRRDLSVLEKAEAFQDYIDRFDCSQEELANRLSLDRSTISNMIRLLSLCEDAKIALREEKISAGHARAILSLDEPGQQAMCQQIQKESLSVRATEKNVKASQAGDNPDVVPFPKGNSAAPGRSNHIDSIEQQLCEQFSAKVVIKLKTADSGQVVIPFATNDDFERILQTLRRVA
ncbi:MAG: ParB/RepB/Spo0J family partition protein [Planctomycetaceae bacterium]|jgi:ParB family transcriptional regulator, chromosome partitioning protein|nr:ParB/RepB/Spo0J family partition protein [Planctomycetaceae bacterium]MDG2390321.1 ParB/RepB/Spo0J family partition protein [Planctomycetaceae bacterium]